MNTDIDARGVAFPTIYQRTFSPTPETPLASGHVIHEEEQEQTGKINYVDFAEAKRDGFDSTEYLFRIPEERKLGKVSTALLIVNRMIGSGIFTTSSTIIRGTGNMGLTLFFWLIGGLVSMFLSVYLEFGTALPRSGGEKVYLERIFRSPKYLATCLFAFQFVTLQVTAANVLIFVNYMFLAAHNYGSGAIDKKSFAISTGTKQSSTANLAGTGFAVISCVCLIHAFLPRLGIYISNGLGSFKLILLLVIICTGFAALSSSSYFKDPAADPHNFREFGGRWNMTSVDNPPNYNSDVRYPENCGKKGSSVGASAISLAQVIFGYQGWENANYVLGEVRDAPRTLRISAPIAVLTVTVLYVLTNIAYEEILKSQYAVVVSLFSKLKVADDFTYIAFPIFIALSALGNLFATTFSFSRAKQELGKEGILPYPRLWASDWPRQAPSGGLLLHWIVTSIYVVALAGSSDGYTFLTLLATYVRTILNCIIGFGLLWLQYYPRETWRQERTSFHVWWPLTVIWTGTNLFLICAQFLRNCTVPSIPYYVAPVVGMVVFAAGVPYWFGYSKILPMLGWQTETQIEDMADGSQRVKYLHRHTKDKKDG